MTSSNNPVASADPVKVEQSLQEQASWASDSDQTMVSFMQFLEDSAKKSGVLGFDFTTRDMHLLEATLIFGVGGFLPILAMAEGGAVATTLVEAYSGLSAALSIAGGSTELFVAIFEPSASLNAAQNVDMSAVLDLSNSGASGIFLGTVGSFGWGRTGLEKGVQIGSWVETFAAGRDFFDTYHSLDSTNLAKAASSAGLIQQVVNTSVLPKSKVQTEKLSNIESNRKAAKTYSAQRGGSEAENILDTQQFSLMTQSVLDSTIFGGSTHPYWGDPRTQVPNPVAPTQFIKIQNVAGPLVPDYLGGEEGSFDLDYNTTDEDNSSDPILSSTTLD